MPEYNFENLDLRVNVPVSANNLSHAFTWANTPQGYEFWRDQHYNGLSEEGKAAWKDMREQFLVATADIPTRGYFVRYYDCWDSGDWKRGELRDVSPMIAVDGEKHHLSANLYLSNYTMASRNRIFSQDVPEGEVCQVDTHLGNIFEVMEEVVGKEYWPSRKDKATHALYQSMSTSGVSCPMLHLDNFYLFEFQSSILNVLHQLEVPDQDKPEMVSLYLNLKDHKRGRKTTMRVGRALKKMFPQMKDAELAFIQKSYLDKFKKMDYTLKTGKERNDFAKAYGDRLAPSLDPYTTDGRKSMHNSCMRGVLTDDGTSPAEVYASGDFTIVWLEDGEGLLAGRVVVFDNKDGKRPQAGPCYGVSEQSLNELEEYLKSINAVLFDEGADWTNARILFIEEKGLVVGPYFDLYGEGKLVGDYIILGSYGCDYEFYSTEGYASNQDPDMVYCEDCDNRFDSSHEGIYTADGHYICDCCSDNYAIPEDGYDYMHLEDLTLVYYKFSFSTHVRDVYYIDPTEAAVWCECVSEWWIEGDTIYSEKMEDYVPNHLVDEYPEYFNEETKEEEGEAA